MLFRSSPQTLAKMTMAFVDDGARAFLNFSMEEPEKKENEKN